MSVKICVKKATSQPAAATTTLSTANSLVYVEFEGFCVRVVRVYKEMLCFTKSYYQ